MGVLVRGLRVESGEGDSGDNNFDAVAPLSLQLCFDLLTTGENQLNFGLATCGRAALMWV